VSTDAPPSSSRLAALLNDLDVAVAYDAPLAPLTWYRIGGRADALVRPASVEALGALVHRCRETDVPLRVLGSGANVLVADEGVDGIVVRLDAPAFTETAYLHRHRAHRGPGPRGDGLRIMAGHKLERVIKHTVRRGMRGLERLAGVPATLGGAIRMNAGGRHGSIGDVTTAVGTLDRDGAIAVHQRDVIEFDYRRCSIIDPVIVWVEVRLEPDDPARVRAEFLATMHEKEASQPLGASSAGCIFRNPLVTREGAHRRLGAGRLIDEAGLKGTCRGGAEVSPIHANFITARPGSRADDVIALIEHVEAAVEARTGVRLNREVVVWSRRRRRGEAAASGSGA